MAESAATKAAINVAPEIALGAAQGTALGAALNAAPDAADLYEALCVIGNALATGLGLERPSEELLLRLRSAAAPDAQAPTGAQTLAGAPAEASIGQAAPAGAGAPEMAPVGAAERAPVGAATVAPVGAVAVAPVGAAAHVGAARAPATGPAQALAAIQAKAESCTACVLSVTRKNVVFGQGVPNPSVLVVGEGPGAEEDNQGLPFVGASGKLLDKMLASIGLSRDENCYIANIVKCRPPNNREPAPDERSTCMPFLREQINILKPKAILCAGRTAAQALLATTEGINRLRTRMHEFEGIPLVATFHPSALLRDETLKRPAWEDLKRLRDLLAPGPAIDD